MEREKGKSVEPVSTGQELNLFMSYSLYISFL